MIYVEDVRKMSKINPKGGFLIDRTWPKGIIRLIPHKEKSAAKKSDLAQIHWRPQLAPSLGTWKWFEVNPEKVSLFRSRYFRELQTKKRHWMPILRESIKSDVALLFDSRESSLAPAHFLKEFLDLMKTNKKAVDKHVKFEADSLRGVAVPVEKAASRKGMRPLKEERNFKAEQKLTFTPPGKRRIL